MNKLTKLFIAITFTVGGCSILPKTNYYKSLKVVPDFVAVTKDSSSYLVFRATQYYDSPDSLRMGLVCEFRRQKNVGKILPGTCSIYLNGNRQATPAFVELLVERNEYGVIISTYYVEFQQCCKNFPLTVSIDSLPAIIKGDTIYKSIELNLSK